MNIAKALPYLQPAPVKRATAAAKGKVKAKAKAQPRLPLVTKPFVKGIVITYVVDEPDVLEFVQKSDLTAARDADWLHAKAMKNLAALVKKNIRAESYGDVFILFVDGHFEASTLLLDDVWDVGLQAHLGDDLVAVVPTRDVLAVAKSSSKKAIAELKAVVKRVFPDGEHVLTKQLLRRHKGKWKLLA